jgi:hypothetical protein
MTHRHPVTTGHAIGSSAGAWRSRQGCRRSRQARSQAGSARAPDPRRPLRGFGGIHGGLALALMTSAMQRQAAGEPLRSVTGRYHRPITGEFRIEVTPIRAGMLSAPWPPGPPARTGHAPLAPNPR